MPTTEQKLAAVHGYVAAFDAGSVDAIIALFAEDATVEDPLGTPVKRGHAEIREFYGFSMRTGAKLELLGPPRFTDDYVAFPFAVKLHFNGADQVIDIIDTFRLNDDGKIVEMRAYWGPENMRAA